MLDNYIETVYELMKKYDEESQDIHDDEEANQTSELEESEDLLYYYKLSKDCGF